MKIKAKDLKIGDIFTESGLTLIVTKIKRDDLINGKEGYNIEAISIAFNKKMFPKNMKTGLTSYYHKKAETTISVRRAGN